MKTDAVITIRLASQADIDATAANASFDQAAAIDVDNKLAAVLNEYNTAYLTPHVPDSLQGKFEDLIEAAGDIWAVMDSKSTFKHQDRGWVIVGNGPQARTILDVYNHKPTEEDVHFAVIECFDREQLEIPLAKSGCYYSNEDLPEGFEITVHQIGEPIAI